MEHTALEIDLILLTLVIRFIFWKELNTQHHHLCSSNQSSEGVKGYEPKEPQCTSAEEHSLCKSHFVGVN